MKLQTTFNVSELGNIDNYQPVLDFNIQPDQKKLIVLVIKLRKVTLFIVSVLEEEEELDNVNTRFGMVNQEISVSSVSNIIVNSVFMLNNVLVTHVVHYVFLTHIGLLKMVTINGSKLSWLIQWPQLSEMMPVLTGYVMLLKNVVNAVV